MKPDNHNNAFQEKLEQNKVRESKLKTMADALSKAMNQLPARKLRIILLCIGIIGAAICVTLIIKPQRENITIIGTQPSIVKPQLEQKVVPSMSKEDYLNLVYIKKTLDSLSRSTEGRAQLNQWLMQNPGFVDSLNFLLEAYQHQDNK